MNKMCLIYENNCVIVAPYLILVYRYQYGPSRAVSVCLGGTAEEAEEVDSDSDSDADSDSDSEADSEADSDSDYDMR